MDIYINESLNNSLEVDGMRIAIIGATGKMGSLLLEEALNRGHNVTVVVRDGSNLRGYRGVKVIEKDILDLEYNEIKRNDLIISALGFWGDDLPLHKKSMEHLINILDGKRNRLLVVGGAGSLFTDESRTTRLMDSEGFPEEYKPTANAMADAFYELEKNNSINWTYLSPAADFQAEGKRTGFFKEGNDILPLSSQGRSEISYGDYAIAMITEAERGHHQRERYSVVSK